jgi:hypothetical protein
MNRLLNLLFVILIPASFFFAADIKGGNDSPGYKMNLSHGKKVGDRTFEFDVYIKNMGKKFVLENYQCSFRTGSNFPANNLQFDYIQYSSEIKNSPFTARSITDEEGRTILIFASHPLGSDTIPENETRIGRFRCKLINSRWDSLKSIGWNFKGNLGTILCSSSKEITNPANHMDFNGQTSAVDENSQLPKVYALSQNFPNPFNPSTKIRISLPFESKIKISVFNALGELVAILADKIEQAGNHNVLWNASGMASGLYIYTIEAEPLKGGSTFKSIKKMMLLK